MRFAQKTLAIFLCAMFAAGPARAQQRHVVPPGAIDQALADRIQDTLAKRQAVHTALAQAEVQRAAAHLGLDVARAEGAVATLEGAELDRIAAQAELVNDEIAGGQTVRLNLLWIIIGLLVLILIILAVD